MTELSKDYEFIAAAMTAISGHLFLSTIVPGPNTKIPFPYRPEYLWQCPESEVKYCDPNSFKERIQPWFYPQPQIQTEQIGENMNTFYIKTLTGKTITVSIHRSRYVYNLKEKIQEKEGIPPNHQKLVGGGCNMRDWQKISDYEIKDDTLHLVLRLGGPPPASLFHDELFDTSKNCDFTWLQDDESITKRGNYVYKRPYGWNRIAINVEDMYDDNKWFGEDPGTDNLRIGGLKDEWPVAYHGNRDLLYNMLTTEESIQGRKSKLEVGFYSSPDPRVAEDTAPIFTFKKRKFKVMIQSRVNMNDTTVVRHQKFYATCNPENIIPCGLLIKHV